MIYRAIQLIQIFLADGQTNEGVPRGPRGPKNFLCELFFSAVQILIVLYVVAPTPCKLVGQ